MTSLSTSTSTGLRETGDTLTSLSTIINNVYENGLKYMQVNAEEGSNAAVAEGLNSIAIGPESIASGESSIAQGHGATASGTDSMAFGTNSAASGESSVAIGANSSSFATNSVALGAGSVADRDNTVSVGSVGNERQITNVAAGTAPTDAVNVGQLNALKGQVDSDIKDLKGGIAAALALEAAPAVAGKFTTYMGVGHYDGQSAIGISGRKTSDDGRWSISGGVTASQQGKVGARVGFTKVW
ncbi:YadA family autotransporter adhesin [Hydromonas duriensis]|uniref:Trimeric autotransporter adhesin n=1 Tax=Hydromonas duriensis TaxID=1527608 RepID=A0A4R6Y4T9_9BURK|nr:YadA-like family protein [Hydromonas duriensis]TDR30179.1 trimeric autotransporter adhesin [Hydromonas duriensis]